MKTIPFLVFCVFCYQIRSQIVTDVLHIQDYSSVGITSVSSNDENYFIAFGNADSIFIESEGYFDLASSGVILKRDGSTIWTQIIESNGYVAVESMVIDSDENLYITGMVFGDIIIDDFSDNGTSFVAKIDNNGNTIWLRIINSFYATSLDLDCESNIIIGGHFEGILEFAGEEYYSESTWEEFPYNIAVLKMSNSGEELWGKTFPGDFQDEVYDLVIDSDCNILLSGSINAGSMWLQNDTLVSGAFLIKLDQDGEDLWTKNISGSLTPGIFSEQGKNVCVGPNNDVYWLCAMRGDSITTELESVQIESCEMWQVSQIHLLLRYSPSGTLLNQVDFQCSQSLTEKWDLLTNGNTVYVVGDYNTTILPSGELPLVTSDGIPNAFLLSLDSQFNVNWGIHTENSLPGSTIHSSDVVKWNNKIIWAGFFQDTFELGDYSFVPVAQGDRFLAFVDIETGITETPGFQEELTLFPNPTSDYINIQHNLEKIHGVKVHDALGNLVIDSKNERSIWVGNLAPGLYYSIVQRPEAVVVRKFIKN